MKLAKAIEIGELNYKEAGRHMPHDVKAAVGLLIEAGKRIRDLRISGRDFHLELLPGEEREEQLEL